MIGKLRHGIMVSWKNFIHGHSDVFGLATVALAIFSITTSFRVNFFIGVITLTAWIFLVPGMLYGIDHKKRYFPNEPHLD